MFEFQLLPSRQITMNDLPVGRSVDETLRLVQVWHSLRHKFCNIKPYEASHPSPRRSCTQTNMEKFVLLAGSLVLIPSFQIPRFLFVLLKKDVKCWTQNFRRNWPTSRNRVTCEDGTNGAIVVVKILKPCLWSTRVTKQQLFSLSSYQKHFQGALFEFSLLI